MHIENLTRQQPGRLLERPEQCRIAGAILAGGRASRLNGLSKGMLLVHGVPIIQRLIDQLRLAGVVEAVIAANDPDTYQDFDVPVVPDIRAGIGPLGGIEAVLDYCAGKADAVLFVPCDTPYLSNDQLRTLKTAFSESEGPVVFAQTGGFFWHPLCAVVHSELLEVVSSAINGGTRSIRKMWREVGAKAIQFPNEKAFFNVNDFADVRRLQCEEDDNGKESTSAGLSVGQSC